MFSNEQIEELRNYFQVKSDSGTKLPNIKTMADGSSFYLQGKTQTGQIFYTKYTVIKGAWYIEQADGSATGFTTIELIKV